VAAEVNTADELVVTELIFNGAFNDLEPPQVAALLSCLVFTERGEGTGEGLPEALSKPLHMLQEAARRVATVSVDAKLDVDVEEYVEHFRPDMMEVVFAWTKGSKFVDICGMTKVFEGTVIRVIRRLEELLRQLADAAAGVGETSLQAKFLAAAKSIRRDIIFAASLYL
jgi:ATP-dependent RNA helicase DOB1